MTTKGKTRLVGLFFGLLGNGFVFASWREAHDQGQFSLKTAVLGPCLLAVGLYFLIEAPSMPVKRPSVLGWTLTIVGIALGIFYAEWLKNGGG